MRRVCRSAEAFVERVLPHALVPPGSHLLKLFDHTFSVFDRQDIQPLGIGAPIEDAVWPDAVRPYALAFEFPLSGFPSRGL